jgi:demethylmenaquinone methyltransferase/2-methoxy-6-polyprenyl-1,4-benzoquinol methylase
VVLDAGCGTGWCLPQLARAVGRTGRIVAFDPSPEMLSVAQSRLGAEELPPVELLHACAEDVVLPQAPDAVLFSYTHDLLRSRRALANLFGQARPGARVAATSTKLYARWLFPANWYLRHSHREYITDFEGFEAPWSILATLLDDFRVETHGATQHYVATGRVRAAGSGRVEDEVAVRRVRPAP